MKMSDSTKHTSRFSLPQSNGKFEEFFLKSRFKERTKFIKAMLFEREIKVITYDRNARNFFIRLTNFYAQIQRIGNNYNQTVRAIKTNFGEKRGLAMLYRLEKATLELVIITVKVHEITHRFEQEWLTK